jgi:hypothetical protein
MDLVAIVGSCPVPFELRALDWDTLALPVPAELFVYTQDEWERMGAADSAFVRVVEQEAVWLFVRDGGRSPSLGRKPATTKPATSSR